MTKQAKWRPNLAIVPKKVGESGKSKSVVSGPSGPHKMGRSRGKDGRDWQVS